MRNREIETIRDVITYAQETAKVSLQTIDIPGKWYEENQANKGGQIYFDFWEPRVTTNRNRIVSPNNLPLVYCFKRIENGGEVVSVGFVFELDLKNVLYDVIGIETSECVFKFRERALVWVYNIGNNKYVTSSIWPEIFDVVSAEDPGGDTQVLMMDSQSPGHPKTPPGGVTFE